MADQNIRGGRELQEFLSSLPAKLEQNILRSALSAGARVVAKEAKAKVPVSPPNSRNARLYGAYAGALQKSIKVVSRSKNGRITASVKVGDKIAYYAKWVEFGTWAHSIKKGAKRKAGTVETGVPHPGARPRPFLRPAFDEKQAEAVAAVAAQVRKRLTKEGINSPAPEEP